MIYPLQNAIARNQVLAIASHLSIDQAMRAFHDGDIARFHQRMKTDETRCRWCGAAAAEARAELEAGDGDE